MLCDTEKTTTGINHCKDITVRKTCIGYIQNVDMLVVLNQNMATGILVVYFDIWLYSNIAANDQ